MGNKTSSSSNQKYNTTYVNTTDTQLLNQSTNDFISNSVSNQAKACSASISQIQSVKFKNIKVTGDFNAGDIDQNQSSAITFDCVQTDTIKNDIANGILSKYMDAIQNSFSTEALDKMEATAGASLKNSVGGTGIAGNVSSKTNVNYDFKSTNTTRTNIENVVKNAIQNNVSMESVQQCISNIKSDQSVEYEDINVIDGNFNGKAISQTQGATLMAKCIQNTDSGNKVTNNVASDLGVTISSENEQKKSTAITSTSTAESSNAGVGEALNQTLTGMGHMLTGVSSIYFGIGFIIIIFCVICAVLLIIAGGINMAIQSSQSSEQNTADYSNENLQGGARNMIADLPLNLNKIGKMLIDIKKENNLNC